MAEAVRELMKVSVDIMISRTVSDPVPHQKVSFVCGLGGDGLTLFEMALYGKMAGEKISMELESAKVQEFFGHLWHQLQPFSGNPGPSTSLLLEVTVTGVETVAPREIVRQLAQTGGHGGCGGSCGCGCG